MKVSRTLIFANCASLFSLSVEAFQRPCLPSSRPSLLSTNGLHHPGSAAFASPLFMSAPTAPTSKTNGEGKVAPSLPGWDPTNWTPKRIWNNNLVRSATILLALWVAAGKSSTLVSKSLAGTIHLLGFGTWIGTVLYTTFIAGLTMYKNLPRQTFGKLQSKLFPKYFMLSSTCIVMQIVTLPMLGLSKASSNALYVALAVTLLNQFYLEPVSTKTMYARYELEEAGDKESSKYKKLAADFGKYHGISSLTNLIGLIGGVVHAAFLGASLVG